jgi:PST family polysaccharide transporter
MTDWVLFFFHRLRTWTNLSAILKNIFWLSLDKFLKMGFGFILMILMARYLGPDLFGAFNYATAFVLLFGVLASLGLKSVVVRDIVNDPGSSFEIAGTSSTLLLIAGFVGYLLCVGAVLLLRNGDTLLVSLVAIMGTSLLFKVSETATFLFEANVQSKFIVLVQNGCYVLVGALKITAIHFKANLIVFAWLTVLESLLVAGFLLVVFHTKGVPLQKLRIDVRRAKVLIKDSFPIIVSSVAIMVYLKIDQIMLGQMIGDGAVGVYSVAVRISEFWYFVPAAIVASTFPALLGSKKISHTQYYNRIQQLYDLMILVSVFISTLTTLFATPVLESLLGASYQDSSGVLMIQIWGLAFASLGIASGRWFLAENRLILATQRSVLGACLNVLLNLWLIPIYSIYGAAIATVVTQLFAAFLFDLIQKETRPMFFMKLKAMHPASSWKLVKAGFGTLKYAK